MTWTARLSVGGAWGATMRSANSPVTPPHANPARLFERALTLAAMASWRPAMAALREVTAQAPAHGPAWREMARLLRLAGQDQKARAALARSADLAPAWPAAHDARPLPEIEATEARLRARMREIAEPAAQRQSLRGTLEAEPTEVAALRLLGRLDWMAGDLACARALFERGLELAPHYEGLRFDLARVLQRLADSGRFAAEAERLAREAPENGDYRALLVDARRAIGDIAGALPLIETLVAASPDDARARCVQGQALHFAGRLGASASAYRRALAIDPGLGEAWWGLAELRGAHLGDADIAAMRAQLGAPRQTPHNARLLRHALGQALERAGEPAGAFAAYASANRIAREIAAETGEAWDPDAFEAGLDRRRAAFPRAAAPPPRWRAPAGAADRPTPIFVVGLPRAGSTLVEQILASHPAVEATAELPVVANIARDLAASRRLATPDAYPECVASMTAAELAALGARYLKDSAPWRRSTRPFFVDKRPDNWMEAGLIARILPGARIIDVRREPMAGGFAAYKQMLADAPWSNALEDVAHHSVHYSRMMAHWDEAMPGRIHPLSYERLVDDPETEIRRLLDYCGLAFDPACLRFWEHGRVVATPSAEQVRRPIYRDALTSWRAFEPWLTPLREALARAQANAGAEPPPEGYDKAVTMAAAGYHEAALESLADLTRRESRHPGAWRAFAGLLRLAGRDIEADRAEASARAADSNGLRWRGAVDARSPERVAQAERGFQEAGAGLDRAARMKALRERLFAHPADSAAAHLLSGLEWEDGDELTALALLERTLDLSPRHARARANLVRLLLARNGYPRALAETAILVRDEPDNPAWLALRADALGHVGDYAAALTIREQLAASRPDDAQFRCALAQTLHALGRAAEAQAAFRDSLRLSPLLGQAWWGLADLKGDVLTPDDVADLREHLADPAAPDRERMYMAYALGHALERAGDFAASFAAYEEGARLFRAFFKARGDSYAEPALLERLRGQKRVFVQPRLAESGPAGPAGDEPTPIFIVGMPRAGSTLVEQILASHPLVEGTSELPAITEIVRGLDQSRRLATPHAYPDLVAELGPDSLAALGRRYLEEAAAYRRTDRPFFTDKRPWNWIEAGFIHLILPRARIVDVRREPMAACFAMFKQVLLDGADFSYDLHDLGRYYVEYAGLMEHWRAEMPGKIHCLRYEKLVEDTEAEVRRLLDYCGLPFDPACLEFWRARRAVSTPSAEQVRRPIFRDALAQWRNFEPWLGSLEAALNEPPRA